MMFKIHSAAAILCVLFPLAYAQACRLQFDGRIPANLAATDLDVPNDIFSNSFVIGQGLSFSDALQFQSADAGSLVRHLATCLL